MFLYGSLSSGDFDLKASDIDFLVVTTDLLSPETIAELEAMHNRIWSTGLKWASKLEGSYIPKDHLRRYEKTNIAYPTVNEGRFYSGAPRQRLDHPAPGHPGRGRGAGRTRPKNLDRSGQPG